MSVNDTSLLHVFLYFQNQVRLYHWKTKSHPRHNASGDLYKDLDPLIDLFIESLQGSKDNGNYRIPYDKFELEFKSVGEKEIVVVLTSFKDVLEKQIDKIISKNSDLANIRDEMLSEVNKTLYRFSMK